MGERMHNSHDAETPKTPTSEEVAAQLEASFHVKREGEIKAVRAEETAGDMSRILKRIAEAMDRNPTSWDALFTERKR